MCLMLSQVRVVPSNHPFYVQILHQPSIHRGPSISTTSKWETLWQSSCVVCANSLWLDHVEITSTGGAWNQAEQNATAHVVGMILLHLWGMTSSVFDFSIGNKKSITFASSEFHSYLKHKSSCGEPITKYVEICRNGLHKPLAKLSQRSGTLSSLGAHSSQSQAAVPVFRVG